MIKTKNAKKDISSREDIEKVITYFYQLLMKKASVGKFFTTGVSSWNGHLTHVADYWESRLFSTDAYDKSVLPIHIDIDKRFGNTFEPAHFREWLKYWNFCVDKHFKGEKATLSKEIGSKMAENIYKKMFLGRKTPEWHEIIQ